MVYEVCALVATIILGVLGLELTFWIRSVRKLTDEAKQTIQDLNKHLPGMLEDVQAVTNLVRQTSDQVGGTVSQVAVSLEEMRKNPLLLVTMFMGVVKRVKELWKIIVS